MTSAQASAPVETEESMESGILSMRSTLLVVDDEETGAGKQEAKGAATSSSGYELTTGWYVAIAITLFVFAVLVLSCKNNSSAAAPQRKDTVLARM